jgi:hypothetical protein
LFDVNYEKFLEHKNMKEMADKIGNHGFNAFNPLRIQSKLAEKKR